ncbi:MAG: FecR protein [Labilithrix sp.]|nr:FecR protein [Labilithrix sp.]
MKSDHPKIPVEPLSEARWEKIDAAVFDALDGDRTGRAPSSRPLAPSTPRRTRMNVVVLSGVCAAAAAVLLFFALRESRPAAPHAERAEAVMNPSHIETGDSPSRLAVGESTIEVGPSSAVVASGDDAHGVLVVVEKGAVDCEVTPRKDRPPFVVQAGNVRVRVVGTRFVVTRDAASVRVKVAHGAVEVSRGADVTMLHDGESWPLLEPAPAPPAPVPPSAVTASAPSMMPSTTPAPTSPRETFPRLHLPGDPPGTISPPDAKQIYDDAARVEATQPDSAMVSYRRLAANGGPWAPPALFAAGRLASDRGQTNDAKRLLAEYVTRYPKGPNAEDARKILARLR